MVPSTQWMKQAFPDYSQFASMGGDLFPCDFKAIHGKKEHRVLFKLIPMTDLSHEDRQNINDELTRLHGLRSPYILNVVDHTVAHIGGDVYAVVILERFSGTLLSGLKHPLSSLINDSARDKNSMFCSRVLPMAGAVRDIHALGMHHPGINPHEFLIDTDTMIIKLNGFAWDYSWRPELPRHPDSSLPAGIFPYISPEQTGRTALSVDLRSNLYSLGVIFYEILTGLCPFPKNNSLDTIYSHMAKEVTPPAILDRDIHPLISDLVMKMLAKSPGDRYQSISGVLHDLKAIDNAIEQGRSLASYRLADHDVSPVFSAPGILYGRDAALRRLTQFYQRVAEGGSGVVFVAGEPGVGKTELIRLFSREIRAAGGIFISVKFDKNQQDVPMKGPKSALASLLKWLLTLSPEASQAWREKILEVVGPCGRILTDLVPEMEKVLGTQPRLKPLPPMETNIRFTRVLDKFVSLFLSKEHPLVMFLDDLQWADKESLEYILAFLASRKRTFCMGVGAYRGNEPDESKPNFSYMKRLKSLRTPCDALTLGNLESGDTLHMVADILGRSHDDAGPLARFVHEKTGGNPFFIVQFMTSMYSSGLICYDFNQGWWTYDEKGMSVSTITDNVATLLSEKIKQLSPDTLDVLAAASCMGNRLDVGLLSVVLGKDPRHILEHMKHAMDEGLLRGEFDPANALGEITVEFTHDHILQGVYHTLPVEEARRRHLAIGRAMLKQYSGRMSVEQVFDSVHHFRQGLPFITSGEEKIKLARLNLEAGQRAIESVSFESALAYFRQAAFIFPERSWITHYELADAIFNWLAKCEFILGHFDASEKHYAMLLDKAGRVMDKVRIYSAMVELYASSGKIDKAVELGRTGLTLLGINIPIEPGPWSFLGLLIHMKIRWSPKKFKMLIDSPEIRDHEMSMVLGLMTMLGLSSFYANPRKALWLALKGGLLALTSGGRYFPMDHATIELNVLGAFLSQIPGFRKMGRTVSRMGMELLEDQTYDFNQAVGSFLSSYFNRHWTAPIRESFVHLKRTCRHAFNVGDIGNPRHGINTMFLSKVFAVHSIDTIALTRLYLGDNLDDIIAYHKKQEDFVIRTRATLVISYYAVIGQMLSSLKGDTHSPTSLDNERYNSVQEYRKAIETSDHLHIFFLLLFELKLFVLYRQWDKALARAVRIDREGPPPPGSLTQVEYHFYAVLAAVGVGCDMPARPGKNKRRHIIKRGLKNMKHWARLRPDNFGHLLSLMHAETYKLSGKTQKALAEYRRAIDESKARDANHITAMACEAAGSLLLNLDDSLSASTYLNEAKKYYHFWGASAKVADMTTRYPGLVKKRFDEDAASPLAFMDFTSLVGALQAISREIEVKNVLSRLMRILMESASATRAVFISHKDGQLFVELERLGDDGADDTLSSGSVELRQGSLLAAVVYYVKRILSPVVLNDIQQESDFMEQVLRDQAAPKSLACLPMMCKDKLVGILYLENSMTSGVFPPGRIDILNTIASQAAISFENATLYGNVIEKEKHLTLISMKLRNLYSELMLAEERERSRIAIDLHDRIGHALALVKMSLTAMIGISGDDLSGMIENSLEMVDQSIEDTRTLSFEISPPILYHLGLGPALDWLCEETQKKHDLNVYFTNRTNFDDENPRRDRKINILFFQVARELVFNAVKHSRARTLRLMLDRDAGRIKMSIEDDGIGLDLSGQRRTDNEENKGFGLFSIRERFQLVNGHMDIESRANQGTKITMAVPRDHSECMEQ